MALISGLSRLAPRGRPTGLRSRGLARGIAPARAPAPGLSAAAAAAARSAARSSLVSAACRCGPGAARAQRDCASASSRRSSRCRVAARLSVAAISRGAWQPRSALRPGTGRTRANRCGRRGCRDRGSGNRAAAGFCPQACDALPASRRPPSGRASTEVHVILRS